MFFSCGSACWLGGWGCYGQKTYPHPTTSVTLQPHSLQLYIFSLPTLTLPPPSHKHTHTYTSTAPVAPPRLLGEEQGDPGPVRGRERKGGMGATRGEPAPVQPSEALLVRVTDLR